MSYPGEWCESDDQVDWGQGPAVVGETVQLRYIRKGDVFEKQQDPGKNGELPRYRMAPWKDHLIGFWNGRTGEWYGYFPFDPKGPKELFKIIMLTCDDPIVVDACVRPGN